MRAWLLLILAGSSAALAGDEPRTTNCIHTYRQGGWYVVQTHHFQVCSYGMDSCGEEAARRCEILRRELSAKWFGVENLSQWPTCQVVLHPSRESYLKQLGQAARNTAGSSVIGILSGRVRSARIDLRMDRRDVLSASLPHEMTHVVLACATAGQSLPCWAEEGMAVLADSREKKSSHNRDLQQALSARQCLRMVELLSLDTYPAPDRTAVFYGQSLSLVEFLTERGGPHQFVRFLREADHAGYDRALARVYNINSVSELERLWTAEMRPPVRLAMRQTQ